MTYTKDELIKACWTRGTLKFLLYPHQYPIYEKIHEVIASDDPEINSYVIDCSRQFGKSFLMFLIACELCIRQPGSVQVFLGPLKSQVNEIVNGSTFGTIFATCPPGLAPNRSNDSALHFPNGSRIRLAGSDNKNYENLRGGKAHTIFIDEAGFVSDLLNGVLPTVEPMTKTTGGKVIYSSTPPEALDHDFYDVLRDHDEMGLISTYTIWDDKSLTERQLEKIINQCGGRDTTKFKREFECARIAETDVQVLPELSKELCDIILVEPVKHEQHHPYFIKYVVADWGGRDKTAILFAHYNNHDGRVYVEDHLDLSGTKVSPATIAKAITDKTAELWSDNRGNIRYICDSNNVIVQQDMMLTYRLPFIPTSKGSLMEMVGKVRDWLYADRIRFWKPAEFAMKSAATAHWDKNRNGFAKSKTFGHYDHLASLVYLVRNLDVTTNPIPPVLNFNPETQFMTPMSQQEKWKQQSVLNQIFGKQNA